MNKLYFFYGAMGSSKTAQALMCRFNYMQKGFNVFLFKPKVDRRTIKEGKAMVCSRIGLTAQAIEFDKLDNFDSLSKLYQLDRNFERNVIIIDECQFLTRVQVEQLKLLSFRMPVLCYGLLTNYKTELFEGSKRLVEISDKIQEIKSVCDCGRKATVNARIVNGEIMQSGKEIMIGGDEQYQSMCYKCYYAKLHSQEKSTNQFSTSKSKRKLIKF